MPFEIVCQVCGQRLHIPVRGETHRVVCPGCHSIVYTRAELERAPSEGPETDLPPATDYFRDLGRTAEGLGTASLLAALLALPILCIPFLGYGSLLVSGAGVCLGIAGLWRNFSAYEAELIPAEEVGGLKWYQKRRILFPLAGMAASLLIFLLTIWPLVKE